MKNRKYLPTLSELIDRLSIAQLKEVFISEHKQEYAQEIEDIIHDINILLPQSSEIDGEMIRAIVVLSQMNLHQYPKRYMKRLFKVLLLLAPLQSRVSKTWLETIFLSL